MLDKTELRAVTSTYYSVSFFMSICMHCTMQNSA